MSLLEGVGHHGHPRDKGVWARYCAGLVFNSNGVFLRHSGFTLLLIPFCWGVIATLFSRLDVNIWIQRLTVFAGIAAIGFDLWYFMVLGFNPCII